MNPDSDKMNFSIPNEVKDITSILIKAGYKAYVVGGSVRDLLLKNSPAGGPKDWDVATDAKPEEIQKLFSTFAGATADRPATVYENQFGTVGVKTGSENKQLAIIEVTTFRKEETYSDLRHPDNITFAKSIEEDLARRDFTVNAMALNVDVGNVGDVGDVRNVGGDRTVGNVEDKKSRQAKRSNERSDSTLERPTSVGLIDPFGGQDDLESKVIRAVGDPRKRFAEDALRLMRAVRFAAELGFNIEEETESAVKSHASLISKIAKERIRDEFSKILLSNGAGAMWGVEELERLNLLSYVMPELREGIGVTQNKHHIYTVWEHNILSLDYAAKQNYGLEIRMAALLHDIGKPRTKDGDGPNSTFYNHEIVGARMAEEALERLRFSSDFIKKVSHLIRYHMFYYNVDEVSAAGVRRFLNRVGPENVDDFIKLREADRIGSGVPKAVPYKLRHLLFMIEKVKKDPISHRMLAIDGNELMQVLNIEPGPRVGWILAILLESVIDEPSKNDKDALLKQAKELTRLGDEELETQAKTANSTKSEFESGIETEMKKKFFV